MFRDSFRIVCLLLAPTVFACSQGGSDPYGFLLDGRNETYLPIYSLAGKYNSGAAIEASLTRLILSSRSSVYCSFYDVTSPGVLDALLLKKAGGVDVRIGLSGRAAQSTGYEALAGALTTTGRDRQLWISDSSGENDLNLCVGDRTRIWLSTVPPMPDRLTGEAAYSAYIQSGEDDIARKFSTELDLVTHGSFGPNKQKLDRRNYWLISDASIGVYFEPAENTLTSFLFPRIADAKQSVQIYSSEFYSNSRDGSGFRKQGDLAFEFAKSTLPSPSIVGTFHAFRAEDPAAKDENGTDFETYWNIDTTHTDPNSLYYLFRKGKDVRIYPYGNSNGLNFVLIDAGTRNPQLYVASHPISGDAESKTDGVFLVLEYGPWVLDFADFFARLQALSVAPPASSGDSASAREVVISELMWMGAVRRDGSSSPYEYIELYNNSDRVINLTDWKVECGANGAFTDAFVLSSANEGGRLIIGPGQYLVLTDDTSASADANAYVRTIHTQIDNAGSNAISDSADQCRLVDTGSNVIDTAGESGKPFLLNPDRAGKVDGDSGAVRSMERTDLAAPGSELSNWHTNSHSRAIENGNILLSFAGYSASSPGTFGTPGYANSANAPAPTYRNPARSLKINEFYYNGSTDYWLEIYNTGTESINLSTNRVYFIRDSDCDLSNGVTTADPLSGTIAPGGFFLLTRDSAVLSGSADQTTSAALNTDDCIALIFSSQFADATDNRVIDFIGFDNSGSKENASTLTLGSGIAVSRCSDGADTNVNANDFSAQSATPKASNQCVVPQGIFYTTSLESGDPTFTKLSGAGTFSATGCPGSLIPRTGSQAFYNSSVTTASNDGGRDMESSCIALPNTRPVQLSYYHIADLATLGGSSLNTRARLYWFTDASCATPATTANTLLGSGGQTVSTSGYGNYLQSTAVPSDATYVRIRIMIWSSAGAASNGNWCVDDVSLEGL